MFLTNRSNLSASLDDMISQLSSLKEIILAGDEESLKKYIKDARREVD
jgi:prephenate dehydrogenase